MVNSPLRQLDHDAGLINVPRLVSAYYTLSPDLNDPTQRVSFGTSGHRGTSLAANFNEPHILAVCQAICDYRRTQGIDGPLYLGIDTHALSEAALASAIEVFAANEVVTLLEKSGYTPTPAISYAILTHNRGRSNGFADGVIITPSHNPPGDGGLKYNPPHGGPADSGTTRKIEELANQHLADGLRSVRRWPLTKALNATTTHEHNFMVPYVEELAHVIDMDAIASSGLTLGVDPMGGAAVGYWDLIAERYKLSLQIVNRRIDPTFSFMPRDKDGLIRMDCSSPHAMAHLIRLRDQFDLAFGNDPDVDRHGIVTRSAGLLNPNHYLAVAINYLFRNRPTWSSHAAIGKTLVSSSMIDRVATSLDRPLAEVPVGFKWFVDGLASGNFGFGGEESAGASFLRRNGTVWTTDKDGIILNLLAAEITARTHRDPSELYSRLEQQFGTSHYQRVDAPVTARQKKLLGQLSSTTVTVDELAGEKITAILTHAPANQAPIGGIKVITTNGWFAARPSGTEDVYKLYAESFKGADHLRSIQDQAQTLIQAALAQQSA